VILGAREKVARLRAERVDHAQRRKALAERVRRGDVASEREAADEVRRSGWARP
jgi:hypothetical protein